MSVHYIYSGTLKLQDPSHFSGFGVAISALASAGAIDVAIQRLDDMVQSGFPAVACLKLSDMFWYCICVLWRKIHHSRICRIRILLYIIQWWYSRRSESQKEDLARMQKDCRRAEHEFSVHPKLIHGPTAEDARQINTILKAANSISGAHQHASTHKVLERIVAWRVQPDTLRPRMSLEQKAFRVRVFCFVLFAS